MKHALFDTLGHPLAFYSDDIHGSSIPKGTIGLSDAQWLEFVQNPGARRWEGGAVVAFSPNFPPQQVPDRQSLSDWRVGLILWKRLDDVVAKVAAEKEKGSLDGLLADERLNYSNFVIRSELMQFRLAFGFSEPEVDESLWRADRVRSGDMSGVWPL